VTLALPPFTNFTHFHLSPFPISTLCQLLTPLVHETKSRNLLGNSTIGPEIMMSVHQIAYSSTSCNVSPSSIKYATKDTLAQVRILRIAFQLYTLLRFIALV
jgi:hypothetical protein